MTTKMILIVLIFFFLGIVALPATMSLFAGQHVWYDLGAAENYAPCVKCHADIAEELDAGGHHKDLYSDDINEACEACHRGNASITYESKTGVPVVPGEEAHAASTINCGYCHFDSSNPTGAPVAGGFGQSDVGGDTGANASHYSFVVQSRTSNLLQETSESCVACHTTLNVTLNFNVSTGMALGVEDSYTETQSYWDITSITPSGYTTHEEVKEG
jgi:hypothetical protein